MNLYLLWGIVYICLTIFTPAKSKIYFKLNGEVVKKVEIGFDFVEGNALITYNDLWKSKGKIFYSEKKKVVVYKDEEIGHCLLEKITKHKETKRRDGELSWNIYHISEASLDKVKAEKLAGKKLLRFCAKFPIVLLKEYSVENNQKSEKLIENNGTRVKRESDVIRGKESQLSEQEISKKLFEDLANADGLDNKNGKGIKRNVDDGNGHGSVHHPSASSKIGQPATVDYHARIRNDLSSGAHPIHPIDITSSVTIATGASHPVWSYSPSATPHFAANGTDNGQSISPSHGASHHSSLFPSQQNNSEIHHHGHHHPPNGQILHQDIASHPSSSGQYFKISGYYPPSSTSKSQQNIPNYPPSSVSKTPSISPHYPPSMFSRSQQNVAYYPPSSTSKTQNPSHFPPSSISKSQPNPTVYPSSSSSKSHHPSSSDLSRPAYYPPSSFSKTFHNETSGDGIHPSLNSKTKINSQFPSNSYSSHGYHSSSFPPSSTNKIHYSVPQSQNTSYSSFYHGGIDPGRSIYAPQFPPSSTSKIYPQQRQYGTNGRSEITQYLPSSTSKIHHSTLNSGHGGSHDPSHGISQYPPSSSSKVSHMGSYYAPQFPPSSTSKQIYSPSTRDSFYSHPPVLERPSTSRNAYEPVNFPPSSSSKVHYSPHSHVMSAGGNSQYYPPSSSSKVNHSPTNSDPNHQTSFSYPPSSMSKVHYSHSPGVDTPVQIPQPPTDKNLGFPPSSTSKHHLTSSHYPHHYPPSSSSKQPSQSDHSQHQHSPAYYPPSSNSKFHETHQNVSSTKETSSPGHYYPPSSMNNLYHSPIHQTGGRITATGRVSITPGFNYYPPSSSSKNGFVQQGGQHSHGIQHHYYYGPSSSSQHHNDSLVHGSSRMSHSSGHGLHSSYYPTHSSHQPNESITDYNMNSKALHPMEHHPSSLGGQQNPLHHNDTTSGQFSHGGYPPSGHHSPIGEGHISHYPPSSSSHVSQQPLGGRQQQFHQSPSPNQGSQIPLRPCQSPRSLYSITTRTILTPNGAVQRPVSVKTEGEYPCNGVRQTPETFPYVRYAPCSGTFTRNSQGVRSQTPCTTNGNFRKSMSNSIPGPAVPQERSSPQHPGSDYIRTGKEHHERGYGYSGSSVMTNSGIQAELVNGMGHHHRAQFSKLQAAENSTSEIATDGNTGPEYFEENGKSGKDVEIFERNEDEDEDEKHQSIGKPVKYQENENGNKTKIESEEEVKEGDVLEPGDKILGKDGYTILEGFRGRVVSVTGQIAKTRAETGKESRGNDSQEPEKKSNSGQFRYSSDLGRYVKENGEKNYSNCQGEPTFTCSEFLGSNGRAKICKPNPRRNPDGSPC